MGRKFLLYTVCLFSFLLILLIFTLTWPVEKRDVRYTIRKLSVPYFDSTSASSINDHGQVLGNVRWAGVSGNRVYIWEPGGTAREIMLDVKGRPWGKKIGDRGHVFGEVNDATGTSYQIVWSATDGMRKITSRIGGKCEGEDMNDLGQVAGSCRPSNTTRTTVVWSITGEMEVLDLAPGSFAQAINNHGRVFGWNLKGLFISGPDETNYYEDLKEPSLLTDMNDQELVVGVSFDIVGNECKNFRASIWSPTDGYRVLAQLEGFQTHARAINNAGQIVGTAAPPEDSRPHWLLKFLIDQSRELTNQDPVYRFGWQGSRAILWEDGNLNDLNFLIAEDPGWMSLCEARDINNKGQIVGIAIHRDTQVGNMTGFVLTPIEKDGDP